MVKPSSILSSLMSRPKPPAAVSGNSNFNWQPAENTSTSTFTENSFAQYYQSTFFSKLDALNGVKRFHERYRIKGHLGAGAHGLILWATDRTPPQPSVFDTKNSTTTVDSFDLEQNVLETEDAYFQDTSSSGEDSDATTVDNEEGELATKRQIFSSKSRQYAVKRMFIRNRVVPVSVIREIKVLQYLSSSGGRRGGHPHIIDLLDVSPSGSSVNLVFPLLPTNLTTLIYSSPPSLNSRQCALYGRMLAEGVAYLHSNGIIHRDLKPANLLVDWEGILKIADFGQARAIDIGLEVNGRRSELTYQVCTRWYRAPELLYGATNYGYDVDLWSVGCILGEMLGRWPLFKGDTDIEQLSLVVRALGTPKGAWTELLPDFNKITFVHDDDEEEGDEESSDDQILSTGNTRWPRWLESLRQKCCSRGSPAPSASPNVRCPDQALDLLFKLCRYTDRLNAQELLAHPFLNFEPGAGKALRRLLVRSKAVKHLSGPQKNHEPPPPPPNLPAVVV